MDKYSDILETIERTSQYEYIIKSIKRLPEFSFKKLVRLKDMRVGFTCSVITGAASNSLLKYKEQIIIAVANVSDVESVTNCISVYPDRIDFPFAHFPHINPDKVDCPRSLCLTRENFSDWYAEHTFIDLLALIKSWFRDAVNNNLVKLKDKDLWEPLYLGTPTTYYLRHPMFDEILEGKNEAYQCPFQISKSDLEGPVDYNSDPANGHLGLLLYRGANNPLITWIHERPRNVKDLVAFIVKYQLLTRENLIEKIKELRSSYEIIFLQIGFLRPTIVLGKTTRIDYICFKVSIDAIVNEIDTAPVELVQIIDLPSSTFARQLSSTSDSFGKTGACLLGCGAIGSKLAYHLYRCGVENLTFVDTDVMLPHNFLRHGLSYFIPFKNKAESLKSQLSLFLKRFGGKLSAYNNDAIILIQENRIKESLIIDCTASASVMHTIDECKVAQDKKIVRFAISDGGKVGIVYFNNSDKAKLADYYMYLLHKSVVDDCISEDLSRWFKQEATYTFDQVRIGEGCHSNTMKLADDLISTHTSIASNLIRNNAYNSNELYLSFLDYDWKGSCHTERIEIPEFKEYMAQEGWEIRIPIDLEESILRCCRSTPNREIGGYLMGTIDEKRKRIYVLHTYIPTDSKGTFCRLIIGEKGWQKEQQRVADLTANTLIYIGDWHSHPKGSTKMSDIDKATCEKILNAGIVADKMVCLICNKTSIEFHILMR